MSNTKICTRCKEEKTLELFGVRKALSSGRMSECKVCNSERSKRRREADPEKFKAWIASWRAGNKQHVKEYDQSRDKEKKLERTKDWRKRNSERVLEYTRNYCKEHKDRYNAHAAKRAATKLRAIPKMSELDEEFNELVIKEAYSLARKRNKLTGFRWHVDHKVPLRSKIVCGFHCYTNLQVIPAKENQMKSNIYWEDMPDARA